MKFEKTKVIFLLMCHLVIGHDCRSQQDDPYLWLEEIESERSIKWVNDQNEKTLNVLSKYPDFQKIYNKNLEILNSKDRIAEPIIRDNFIYNFWKDEANPRGIWRRCPLPQYIDGAPDWDLLLDIDKLSLEDSTNWVFYGAQGLHPSYNRFMVSLSKGGGDAVVLREFDVDKKTFVESGFYVPESKGSAEWIDENTLLVSADFGEGTLTTSGYPNQLKIWKRGTTLKESKILFEGNATDAGSSGYIITTPERSYYLVIQHKTIFSRYLYVIEDGNKIKLNIPEDAVLETIWKDHAIVNLKSDWIVQGITYKQGSLVTIPYAELLKGNLDVSHILSPEHRSSITTVHPLKNSLLINMLQNVNSKLFLFSKSGNTWVNREVPAPKLGTIDVLPTSSASDLYFFSFMNFLNPTTLYFGNADSGDIKIITSLPVFFEENKYVIKQFETPSKDGTLIPYFVVHNKSQQWDGSNATLLYAYGGFEVSNLPYYSGTIGASWLEKGGIYVLANIRGGGEFGPQWHQDGLKENRQRVYDDFIAVSEDLIKRRITDPKHLGILGYSNGGLLVGVALTQRPELYNAVVCGVPLLDMKRYNKLLAGASWMGEYGNPDIPEEWAYIKKYSPYHNLSPNKKYPPVYIFTSTRDDRVHPGHARKMAAKMKELGNIVYYYENTEGGHMGASTNQQRAHMNALTYSYLLMQLK